MSLATAQSPSANPLLLQIVHLIEARVERTLLDLASRSTIPTLEELNVAVRALWRTALIRRTLRAVPVVRSTAEPDTQPTASIERLLRGADLAESLVARWLAEADPSGPADLDDAHPHQTDVLTLLVSRLTSVRKTLSILGPAP